MPSTCGNTIKDEKTASKLDTTDKKKIEDATGGTMHLVV